MASATDRARFQIEQTVPSLREWEKRHLFTESELKAITSHRSRFETQLASREATPALFLNYLTYEANTTALLSKRIARQSVVQKVAQKLRAAQQKRIYEILDRATRRFHGDLSLWAQYLSYCREQGANKRGQRVLTEVLRLFPTKPEVWGYAARWAEGIGDLSAARGYYLRGLRFCRGREGKDLYLRFAGAEMRWVEGRRKVLGLRESEEERKQKADQQREEEQFDADMIKLPTEQEQEQDDSTEQVNPEAFRNFSSTPAMTGAIPMAVFDQAMKAYGYDEDLAEAFFDTFAKYPQLPCAKRVLQHVVDSMPAALQSCRCRLPLVGVSVDDARFPAAFRESREIMKQAMLTPGVARKLLIWMKPLSEDAKLISELKTVLDVNVNKLMRICEE